jgi:hypothetical protein
MGVPRPTHVLRKLVSDHDEDEGENDLFPPFLDAVTSALMWQFLGIIPRPKQSRPKLKPRLSYPEWLEAAARRPWRDDWAGANDAEWEQNGFLLTERDVWLEAGVRLHEPDLAAKWRAAGLSPELLKVVHDGRTLLDYLRRGESVAQVVARSRGAQRESSA